MKKYTDEEAFASVNQNIDQALCQSPEIIKDYLTHLTDSRGKMLRTKALLLCAKEEDGKIEEGAIYMCCAIEIIHLASLVHDDVIDDADLRRGEKTLQKKYGKKTAVICGDYLLSLALNILYKIPDRDKYTSLTLPDYISRLCLGELRQHINNHNTNLTILEYLKIISGKTAALFEASFFAGGVCSNSSKQDISRYKKIGKYAGLIFQLQDDCLDFDVDTKRALKPVQSDFEHGVITLPLIFAFQKKPEFAVKAKEGKLDQKEVNQAVAETDSLNQVRRLMLRYYQKANKLILQLSISEAKKRELKEMLILATGDQIVGEMWNDK